MLFYSKYFGKGTASSKTRDSQVKASAKSLKSAKGKLQSQLQNTSSATRFLDPSCNFKHLDLVGHFTYMDDQNGIQLRPRAKSE